MAKRRYCGVCCNGFLVLVTIIVFVSSLRPLNAAEEKDQAGPERNIARALRHISADQGRKYLSELGLGTVSQLGKANMLLVTGRQTELLKAKALLDLIDSQREYVVKTIAYEATEQLPDSEIVAAQVGGVSVGTFLDPPSSFEKSGVIVDVHNGSVLAIAPADMVEKVASVIDKLLQTGRGEETAPLRPADPNQVGEEKISAEDSETQDIFDKLLESMPGAAEVLGEPESAPPEPNAPGAAATEPERKAPVQPPLEAEQKEEAVVATEEAPPPPAGTAEPESKEPKPGGEKPTPKPAPEPPSPGKIDKPERLRKPYAPEPVPEGDDELVVELPEKLAITTLIELVGKYLHLDYMYDPTKVKGEVMIKIQKEGLKINELYPTLESVLKFKNLVMTRKDNLVVIVPKEEAMSIDPELLGDDFEVDRGNVIVMRSFKLEHLDAEMAENFLNNMGLGASITPIPETGTLIVAEYAFRMERIEKLLQIVDKPGKPKEFTYRALKYTMAEALAPKIEALAEQLGTVSVSIAEETPTPTTSRTAKGRRTTTRRTTTPKQSTAEKPEVYLEPDERTNRILMIGLPEQLKIVNDLIDSLDVEKQDLRTLRLYDIQHIDAEEVMNKLFDLDIISTGPTIGTATPPAAGAAAAQRRTGRTRRTTTRTTGAAAEEEAVAEEPQVVVVESTNSLLVNATPEQHVQIQTIIAYVDQETLQETMPYVIYPLENQKPEELVAVLNQLIQETTKDKAGKIEKVVKKQEDIIIVGDEKSSSIVVYASKKNQEWVAKLIRELDKRRPQVLIDVTLVEVSKSDKFEYDLNLISSIPDLTNTSGLIAKLMADANSPGNLIPRLTSRSDRRDRFIDFGSSAGSGTGFYGDRHINALLNLMQTKDYGRILAKPKILVNDNEPGSIKTTDTIYVKRVSQQLQPLNTGTQMGSGYYNQAETFDPYDAGISLEITPHISEGDLLRLEVILSRSDFRTVTGEKPPDTTASDITTVVTVPDGSTIILGGMLKLNQSKGGSKVPILGDIPLVGGLFRTIDNSDTQQKLYVFVKAEILRPSETLAGLPDLSRISARDRIAFEEFERQFQQHEDWPGIKPKPMDPLKVLDAR